MIFALIICDQTLINDKKYKKTHKTLFKYKNLKEIND